MTTPGAGTWVRCFSSAPTCGWACRYRSALEYTLTGTSRPQSLTGRDGGRRRPFPREADVKFPDMALLSVVQQFGEKWQLLGDVQYTHWSTVGTINVVNTSSNGDTRDQLVFDFDDAWRIAFGVNYFSSEKWTFRGGIAWDQSPVDDQNRTVRLPDDDRFWLRLVPSTSSARAARSTSATRTCSLQSPSINQTRARPSTRRLCRALHDRDRRLRQLGRYLRCPTHLDVLRPQQGAGRPAFPCTLTSSRTPRCPPVLPFMCARSPSSARASWARRSPRTWSTPTCRPCCSSCRRRRAIPTAMSSRRSTALKKLEPSPLASAAKASLHRGGQLRSAPGELRECDLVIEAVAERMDIKKALYDKVAPFLAPHADLRQQHLRPVDQRAGAGAAGGAARGASAACTSSIRRATCTWWS